MGQTILQRRQADGQIRQYRIGQNTASFRIGQQKWQKVPGLSQVRACGVTVWGNPEQLALFLRRRGFRVRKVN